MSPCAAWLRAISDDERMDVALVELAATSAALILAVIKPEELTADEPQHMAMSGEPGAWQAALASKVAYGSARSALL